MARYEKYPPDMKNIRPISVRHLFGILTILIAGFLGYFEMWGSFGAALALSIILFLGVYTENQYRRIARRLDRMEDLLRENRDKKENRNKTDKDADKFAEL